VREVSDIAALVAARQDRVLPLETLDKLRVNPYLLNQVALNPDMRQQITENLPTRQRMHCGRFLRRAR